MTGSFKYLMHGSLDPVPTVVRAVENHVHLLPRFKSLYLHERSFTGAPYVSPFFLAPALQKAGFEVYLEIDVNNHAYQALLSILLGGLVEGIENMIIHEEKIEDIDLTLSLAQEWQEQLGILTSDFDSGLRDANLFFSCGYSILDSNEELFEKLHVAGFKGIFVPENYDPVKLMNLFTLAHEFHLSVLNSASIFYSPRQVRFALKAVPQLELPDAIFRRLVDSEDPVREGLDYFKEFVEFISSFDSLGVKVENPTRKVISLVKGREDLF